MDLEDISIIMDTDRYEQEAYLDTKTGQVIDIPIELDEDNVYDDNYISGLPKWEQELVEDIKAIYEDEEERYMIIPERRKSDAYELMIRFVKRLENPKVSEELFDALDGKGAFRRFQNTLRKYPKIEEQWYKFKEESEKQEVREWLWSIGIEPIER